MKARVAFASALIGTTVGFAALIYSETQSEFQVALIIVILLAETSIAAFAFLSLKAPETASYERAMAAAALLISVGAVLLVSLFAFGLTQYQPDM